ncbi:LuxR C-terminal-related transcriptional regulator [Streptomyces erythrochromogenes]
MKTLNQDTTRNDPHTTAHAHWLLSRGSEVRTAPVLPQRLVIFDRAHALVPIDPADTRKGALHVTERELLRLLAGGLTDDGAGQRLGISSRTVSRHMASIMERLGATSRFEAGLKAAQRGWL